VILLGLFLVLGLAGYFEYIRIRRYGGGPKELAAFAAMMVVAVGYALAVALNWPVPNPARLIQQVLGPIGERIMPRSW